jgi:2'-5' RNA ligase
MYAVVSLLDSVHYHQVEALWAELKERCHIGGIYATPFPHFSYHVAAGYDLPKLETVLRRVAKGLTPFSVRTAGLGIFTGPSPVVHIPVVRNTPLAALQRRLWPQIGRRAAGSVGYYHPDQWVPHITLGHGDVCEENLPAVIRQLCLRSFSWEIPIDNFAVISSSGVQEGLHLQVPFGRPD